ncbi:MAG: segregation/condensation protein A [Candidatus Aenigmatarchaeota archaeon]
MLDENKILDFIKSDYTWEQIIYEVVAWEGLDPWDLDVCKLSSGFMTYLRKMKEMDFRFPAKYIMVAAILLKMKSDYLRQFKEQVTGEAEQQMQAALATDAIATDAFVFDPLSMPPRREPVRGIVVTELVNALKKVLNAHDRRVYREEKLRRDVQVTEEKNINERIKMLYSKLNSLLSRVKNEEVEFSKIVGEWDRENVVNSFVPLVHLEQQKKVAARQEEMFDEIWVSKRNDKLAKKE